MTSPPGVTDGLSSTRSRTCAVFVGAVVLGGSVVVVVVGAAVVVVAIVVVALGMVVVPLAVEVVPLAVVVVAFAVVVVGFTVVVVVGGAVVVVAIVVVVVVVAIVVVVVVAGAGTSNVPCPTTFVSPSSVTQYDSTLWNPGDAVAGTWIVPLRVGPGCSRHGPTRSSRRTGRTSRRSSPGRIRTGHPVTR